MKRPLEEDDKTTSEADRDEVKVKKSKEDVEEKPSEDAIAIKQRQRKRNKAKFGRIRSQMEFYFSDANIEKSKFMQNLLQNSNLSDDDDSNSKWLNLDIFLKFNKLADLLKAEFEGRLTVKDLFKALEKSPSEVFKVRKSKQEVS